MRSSLKNSTALILLLPLLVTAGCDGPPAEFGVARRLPRDKRPTVWDAPTKERLGVEDFAPAAGDRTELVGDTPEGWVEKPPRQFRDLIWGIPGEPDAECWLTAGVGGGVAGNMMRWYRQFGLPPAGADTLPEVPFAGGKGRLLELTGAYDGKPGMTMLLVFTSQGNQVTSLKLVASAAVAKANRDKFLELAETMRREKVGHAANQGRPGGETSPGPVAPGTPNPHGADSQGSGDLNEPFTADVPSSWVAKAGSSRPLHHTFGTDGEVYVSQLSGPLKQMLNIWRAEVGQRVPLTDEQFNAVANCEMLGADALWLDVTGNYTGMTGKQIVNARVLVAVRTDGGTITFAKLVGSATDVMAEAEAFKKFCASLRRNS